MVKIIFLFIFVSPIAFAVVEPKKAELDV